MPAEPVSEEEITPLSEWKGASPRGFIVTLPESGHKIRMRKTMDLAVMLRAGLIPNPLARIIREMMAEGQRTAPLDKFSDEALDQFIDMVDATVCSAVVEPTVTRPEPRKKDESEDDYKQRVLNWTAPEGTLPIFAISPMDRQFISGVAEGRVSDAATFRLQQALDVEHLQASGEVEPAPKQPPRAVRRAAKSGAKSK